MKSPETPHEVDAAGGALLEADETGTTVCIAVEELDMGTSLVDEASPTVTVTVTSVGARRVVSAIPTI